MTNSHSPSAGVAFRPRRPGPLRVIIVARISTEHQDVRSLADQEAKCREYLSQSYRGPLEVRVIASQGSGEHLDRAELDDLEGCIEGEQYDLVLAEDLGRICRRQHAYELCEDHCTGLIAINDRVDTTTDGWQDSAFIAAWHHERSNRDTAQRIRRSLNHRFDQCGVVQFVLFGYIKPPGARNDRELQKDVRYQALIPDIFRRLEEGATYAEIADSLNAQHIPTGPCCRRNEWTDDMVRSWVHSPILKGIRLRNRMYSKRNNKTGRHRSARAAPEMLRVRECPHLTYFSAEYYDHVIETLAQRNRGCARTANGRPDSRSGVSRKRTYFPGQHARCGICGRIYHWHGQGGEQVFLCSGAAGYRCWNGLHLNGQFVREQILAAISEAMVSLPGFDAVFGDLVRQEAEQFLSQRDEERQRLTSRLAGIERRIANVSDAIEQGAATGQVASLIERLQQLERDRGECRLAFDELNARPPMLQTLPDAEALRNSAREVLQHMAPDDQEGCRLLRKLVPDLVIMPYGIIDGSDIIARAEFTLTLIPLLPPELVDRPESQQFHRRIVTTVGSVSQTVTLLGEVIARKHRGESHQTIACELGVSKSQVSKTWILAQQMQAQGLTEPFIRLVAMPPQTHRLRRHQHPRFRMDPLPGWPRPWPA
ncbi:hypothetical protein GC163_16270 [bacterium]|nr:hypothetical protein [bacterium]